VRSDPHVRTHPYALGLGEERSSSRAGIDAASRQARTVSRRRHEGGPPLRPVRRRYLPCSPPWACVRRRGRRTWRRWRWLRRPANSQGVRSLAHWGLERVENVSQPALHRSRIPRPPSELVVGPNRHEVRCRRPISRARRSSPFCVSLLQGRLEHGGSGPTNGVWRTSTREAQARSYGSASLEAAFGAGECPDGVRSVYAYG
jgi:hypothetical protein